MNGDFIGPLPLCACPCGEVTELAPYDHPKRRWIKGYPMKYRVGHGARFDHPHEERALCGCGCGERVKGYGSQFLRGHHIKVSHDNYVVTDLGFETPCHIWQGQVDSNGYARLYRQENGVRIKESVLVHRQIYEAAHGPLPPLVDVHHRCEQRACIRLEHFAAKERSDHVRGHREIPQETRLGVISALRAGDESQAAICRRLGVTKTFVARVKSLLVLAEELGVRIP